MKEKKAKALSNSSKTIRLNRKSIYKRNVNGFMIGKNKKSNSATKPTTKKKKEIKKTEHDFKRSKSRIEDKPNRIYEENLFEELVKKRNSLLADSNFVRSTTTMESYKHNSSQSPRQQFPTPVDKNFRRRATLPLKAFDTLTDQHQIKTRREFEEAVSCVFEKDIANKSLGRKSRVTNDIILDHHAFKRSNTPERVDG
mmetsp:Transcript_3960/g.3316  ORF Transcript_3960/g.3316 Transcript_3960/m.3316 type:complete len:198 (-) Transcript_3960:89-682(-)